MLGSLRPTGYKSRKYDFHTTTVQAINPQIINNIFDYLRNQDSVDSTTHTELKK